MVFFIIKIIRWTLITKIKELMSSLACSAKVQRPVTNYVAGSGKIPYSSAWKSFHTVLSSFQYTCLTIRKWVRVAPLPSPRCRIYFLFQKNIKNLNSRLAPCTFLRLSLYWPSGRGVGGGCNKKNLSGVFADEWGTESRWRSGRGEKAKLLVHLFRRRYAEDDVRTPPHSA